MKIAKGYIRIIFLVILLQYFIPGVAKDITVGNGLWQITYHEQKQAFSISVKQGKKEFRKIISESVPTAIYDFGDKEGVNIDSRSFQRVEYNKEKIKDNTGRGVCHKFTFTQPMNGDDVSMTQSFYIYKEKDYILTRLTLMSDKGVIKSNYLAPINCFERYPLLQPDTNNRMMRVPFDNDGFVRYNKYRLNCEMTSYEVTAIYEGISRFGIVLGSVEHNQWKSAIRISSCNDGDINNICLFSGVADEATRDVLPHGKIEGAEISSALMYLGCHSDWRDGMEEFAQANRVVAPRRDTWKRGTPFGWQSWGVMADKNSFEADVDISNFFRDTLRPAGFCNSNGINIMSIDAWDNLSREQRIELTAICKENGQVAGTYLTPFCLWWNEDMLRTQKLFEGCDYYGYDCVIKVNGEPYKLDGAYCLDPTHPGTKQMISRDVQRIKNEGFEYVKVDFTSNGMVQADCYYDRNIKTAVQAYNEGFTHFINEADKGEPLFVALSIAPIFPYQYGNSRRIACDTWGKIGHSEYSMNAVGAGWWTNIFYQYNDPDHLVLVGNDEVKESEGENRARVTNGAVSGMMLVSDNYSKEHGKGRGNAELSFERAHKILMNNEINSIANMGRSFKPVYGYKEYNGNPDGAEECVMLNTEEYLYVAIINYRNEELTGSVPFERLGITSDKIEKIKELWSGECINITNDELHYSIPATDAKVFRFDKK